MAEVVYSGFAGPVGPDWQPVNGSRGRRRDQKVRIEYGVVHLWVSPEDGPERYLHHLRTPALPATGRSFQGRAARGQWYWETPEGTQTTDETKAARFPGPRASFVYRKGAAPYPLTPGVSPMPWCYGAGYHCIAGIDGEFHFAANPDDIAANANPPFNDNAVSVCLPGRYQTDAQWQDATSSAELEALAKLMVYAFHRWGIPIVHVGPDAIRRGERGWCGHVDVNNVFHLSDHGDPGGNFPWAQVIARARQILQGDDMAQLVTTPGDAAAFEVSGTSARWIPDWDSLVWMWQRKLVAEKPTQIGRDELKRLHLVGPEPVAPSTIKGGEFGTWVP